MKNSTTAGALTVISVVLLLLSDMPGMLGGNRIPFLTGKPINAVRNSLRDRVLLHTNILKDEKINTLENKPILLSVVLSSIYLPLAYTSFLIYNLSSAILEPHYTICRSFLTG